MIEKKTKGENTDIFENKERGKKASRSEKKRRLEKLRPTG